MADAVDAKWDKLVAMMERLASQPAPTINVNVNLDGKKKRAAVLSDPSNPSEFPEPGGQPRPYVS